MSHHPRNLADPRGRVLYGPVFGSREGRNQGGEAVTIKERPILKISATTGLPSMQGKRLRSSDGLSWRQRNKDAINARKREIYAKDIAKQRDRLSKYRKANKEKVNGYNARWGTVYRQRVRAEMIAAYGGRCACCGESNHQFLQLDHIYNDGAADRRNRNGNQSRHWAKLKKQGWPKDRLQLLCANCNFGKLMNRGVCPHKTKDVSNA